MHVLLFVRATAQLDAFACFRIAAQVHGQAETCSTTFAGEVPRRCCMGWAGLQGLCV